MHFCHFGPNIGIFGSFGTMPDQKTMRTRCLGGFTVMWVPKLLLPPKIIWMFGPKKAIFAPKYAFFGTYRPGRRILCPLSWLVGGCGETNKVDNFVICGEVQIA